MTPVGVVGLGYWGPNPARSVDRLPQAERAWSCDEAARAALRRSLRESSRAAPL